MSTGVQHYSSFLMCQQMYPKGDESNSTNSLVYGAVFNILFAMNLHVSVTNRDGSVRVKNADLLNVTSFLTGSKQISNLLWQFVELYLGYGKKSQNWGKYTNFRPISGKLTQNYWKSKIIAFLPLTLIIRISSSPYNIALATVGLFWHPSPFGSLLFPFYSRFFPKEVAWKNPIQHATSKTHFRHS